ncbi:MAG: dihydropteroate synthase [archaeon]
MSIQKQLGKQILVIADPRTGIAKTIESASNAPSFFLNVESPEKVVAAYQAFADSGADIILTNTAGALRPVFQQIGRENLVEAVNVRGAEIARKCAGDTASVAGHIQTIGLKIEPFGEIGFDSAVRIYSEQIQFLMSAGIDLLVIDSLHAVQEMRAAVIAANSLRNAIPLAVFSKFDSDGNTDDGLTVESFATILDGLQVDSIGILQNSPNKSIFRRLTNSTNRPVSVRFLPEVGDEIEKSSAAFAELGAAMVGAEIPEQVHAIASAVRGREIVRTPKPKLRLPLRIANRSRVISIGDGLPFVKIGERINPTGRKVLAAGIRDGNFDLLLKDAIAQAESGADALDVNVGIPMIDEPATMKSVVSEIQRAVSIPLVLDSAAANVLESGLKVYAGKALVNSVNGKRKRLEEVLPIVKKYGAAVIALTIDETIPETAEERLAIARTILKACDEFKIPKENIIVDVAAMAIASSDKSGIPVLKAIQLVRQELGLPVSLGISNTSFGLPERILVHSAFLIQAIAMGLDAAILNPLEPQIHEQIAAASLFVGRDPDCRNYLKAYRAKKQTTQD